MFEQKQRLTFQQIHPAYRSIKIVHSEYRCNKLLRSVSNLLYSHAQKFLDDCLVIRLQFDFSTHPWMRKIAQNWMPQFEISKTKFFSTHCWNCCWFPAAQIVWQLRFLVLWRKTALLNVSVIKWKQCIKNLNELLRSPCLYDPVVCFAESGCY